MHVPLPQKDDGVYWLRHILLYTASWQTVCPPGTTWRYALAREPVIVDGRMAMGADGRPLTAWRFVPHENKRIALYD